MEQLRYLFSFALIFLLTSTQAQDSRHANYVGLTIGAISNVFTGSEVDFRTQAVPITFSTIQQSTITHALNVSISLPVKHELANWIYLKWGLEYVQRGARENNSTFRYPLTTNVNYLAVPFKLGLQPVNFALTNDDFQLGIEGGLLSNFEVGNKSAYFSKGLHPDNEITIKKQVFSAAAGASAETRLFARWLMVANYTYYKDINTMFSRTYQKTTYDIRNQGWMLTAGVMYLLK